VHYKINGSLRQVSPHVSQEVAASEIRFVARRAHKRLFAAVEASVSHQVAGVVVAFLADVADERPVV